MPRARRSKRTSTAAPRTERHKARLLAGPEAARPLASLVLLAPLLGFYVVGCIWVRPDLAATADIWLGRILELLGLGGILAPTYLAVGVLLVWHIIRGDPWTVSWKLLWLMALETVILVVPLFVAERVFHAMSHGGLALPAAGANGAPPEWLDVTMTSIGAGIYEELLFRLLLVGGPLLILRHVLRDESFDARVAVVMIVAALFSGAHWVNDPGQFAWLTFLFRTVAGIYLGFIFVYRGFGIAAGVHIAFNLVVKSLDALGYAS